MTETQRRFRVLVVDDEEELTSAIVNNLGVLYDCKTAKDGEEALQLLQHASFDAIVSDLRMPRVDGMQLLQLLRSRGDETPFLFLTAFGDRAAEVNAIRLGACEFLNKPFLLSSLRKTLETLMHLKAT